jgi:hypothetical protein
VPRIECDPFSWDSFNLLCQVAGIRLQIALQLRSEALTANVQLLQKAHRFVLIASQL